MDSNVSNVARDNESAGQIMRMHIDSHANMVVLGKECFILRIHKHKCKVLAFVGDVRTLQGVDIVDAVLAFDCPVTHLTILLVVKNALYIPSMTHHLMPPFLIWETRHFINNTLISHAQQGSVNPDCAHCISFEEVGIKICLRLKGIFSYLNTRRPTSEEIGTTTSENIVLSTPDLEQWDPYSEHYQQNEEALTDY